MVCTQMLVVIVRFLQVRFKMYFECKRTLAVASERINVEGYVCLYVEVVYLVSQERVFS